MNSLRHKITKQKLVKNALLQMQLFATSSVTSSEIQVPNRKERGPTDILRALESTIRRDPTAPHYKYIDDPFLIPVSNLEKRSYALSKESGRKAAMWIRQQHSDFFQHRNADPVIESYLPRAVYNDKSQVSEELLLNVIKSQNVTDSLQIYKLLEENVKIETKLSLFELTCFTNLIHLVDDELIEERWFSTSNSSVWVDTWKDNSNRDALFNTLIEAGGDIATAAYNALICGCAKHKNSVKAWDIYSECEEKKISLYKRTYDYLITAIGIVEKRDDARLNLLLKFYTEMTEKNLQPDVLTMNASLGLAAMLKENKRNFVVTVFNEFERINVKPSLTSYLNILETFCVNDTSAKNVLNEILNKLEGQKLELKDPRDTYFFVNAMKNAFECNCLASGKRLYDLLLLHENYVLIGDCYKENVFFRFYMLLHLNSLDFTSFMKVYQEFTPNIYTPEVSVFIEILNVVKSQDSNIARELLPSLFSQALMFDFMRNEEALNIILELMTGHCKPSTESPLNKTFAENAWTTWEEIQEIKATSRRGYNYSATTLENISILLLRGDEFDKMLKVLSVLINEKNTVIGCMRPDFLSNEIFNACMERGHTEAVLSLIEYAIEYGMDEGITMGVRAYKNLAFTTGQENKLQTLVGKEILEVNLKSSQVSD